MNAEKERRAIQILKSFEPEGDPYWLCYSGGKDSDVIRVLAQLANVKHTIENNHTTVDAPETVRYIRSIENVHINYPEESMWELIIRKGVPPTRIMRYCCAIFKEGNGKGRLKITGVRWEESKSRQDNQGTVTIIGKEKTVERVANNVGADAYKSNKGGIILNDDNAESRQVVEHCYRTTSTMINPIIDWSNRDVWDFLHYYGFEGNPLYQCGFSRVGCIGCPMAGREGMIREFTLYPKYKDNYIRAFDKMLKKREERGLTSPWRSGEEVFTWWIGGDPYQMTLLEGYDEDWMYGD